MALFQSQGWVLLWVSLSYGALSYCDSLCPLRPASALPWLKMWFYNYLPTHP